MNRSQFSQVLAQHSPQSIIDCVQEYVSPARQDKIQQMIAHRLQSIQVVIEAPSDPHNAAAIVRSAEALGILHIHVISAENNALAKKSTTQGAFHWVQIHEYEQLDDFLEQRHSHFQLLGAHVHQGQLIETVALSDPIYLLFGNEQRGLSAQASQACDTLYRLPMYGMAESYNLSVAAAMSLYALSTRIRQQLAPANSDLNHQDTLNEKAYAYCRALPEKLVRNLLARR